MINNDKFIEQQRYDLVAKNSYKIPNFMSFPAYHIPPYQYYLNCLKDIISPEFVVLEIGSGLGLFTSELIKTNASIVASDISGASLDFLSKQLDFPLNLNTIILDMELLNSECQYDVICASGSLSYGDNELVLSNIYKSLKPGGYFICVDSLDNNLIYRINRFLHFILGKRSFSTLKNMPNMNLISSYKDAFSDVQVSFFGSFCWIVPLLKPFLSDDKIAVLINKFDSYLSARASSFKFVMVCRK